MSIGPPGGQSGIYGEAPQAGAGMPLEPGPASPTPSLSAAAGAKPDRREFDNQRVKARFIDWLIWLFLYLAFRLYVADSHAVVHLWHIAVIAAVYVTYFFICEAVWGQTLGKRRYGLRVISTDGGRPSLNAIATRNVIRIVEEPVIAVLVMVGSRGRRQRVGDLVASTAVVAGEADQGEPRGGMLIAYPVLWAVGVVVFALVTAGGSSSQPSGLRPVLDAPRTVEVAPLTPDALHFADLVNRSCHDGVHAQVVAVSEILHAARATGASAARVNAVADRALADELETILKRVRNLEAPPETSDPYRVWLYDGRQEVRALRLTATATERGDTMQIAEIGRQYTDRLIQLTQLTSDLGFDQCLPPDQSAPDFSS